MLTSILLALLWIECDAIDYYYMPYNVTRSTLSGIAAYRSSLTLDWMAAEDLRQRELASAYETDAPPAKVINSDCILYPKPAPGKIGRLMMELLKNLEGDNGFLVPELIQVLIRTKILVENSVFESEPDLDLLVKTPGIMQGEPHATFPRIVAIIWMAVTDPTTAMKHGWCPINKMSKYLMTAKPHEIAKHMRALDLVVARARFIMEDFIQSITPMDMYQKKKHQRKMPYHETQTTKKNAKKRGKEMTTKRSAHHLGLMHTHSSLEDRGSSPGGFNVLHDKPVMMVSSGWSHLPFLWISVISLF